MVGHFAGREPRPPSRVAAIVDALSRMIADGRAAPGERVASVRRAAAEHCVSKNTVAEAYDRLVAQGLLEARPGSGYVVAAHTA